MSLLVLYIFAVMYVLSLLQAGLMNGRSYDIPWITWCPYDMQQWSLNKAFFNKSLNTSLGSIREMLNMPPKLPVKYIYGL